MIEIIIERWIGPDGIAFRWSVWRDGRRIEMGGPHEDAAKSETEARAWCAKKLSRPPDRLSKL